MTDPRKFYFNSEYDVDKIIGIHTNTVVVGAPSSTPGYTLVTDTYAHGFGDSCYFQGIFTTDGGVTWNDFGAQIPNLAGGTPQFQTMDVEAMIDAFNVNVYLTNWYDTAHSTTQTYTVTYKIYLLAKNTMALPVTPQLLTQDFYFNTNYNYQKIYEQGTANFSVSSGSTGQTVVAHNLGYVPTVRAFFFPGANQCFALNQVVIPINSAEIETFLDTNNMTFYSDQSYFGGVSLNGTIEYRVYYDA